MGAADYAVIFDVSVEPFTDWLVSLWGLGLVVSGVAGAAWLDHPWKRAGAAFVAFAGLAMTSVLVLAMWSQHSRLQSDYREGRFSIVEGRVRNFVRDYKDGDSAQLFEVRGRTFELWHARPSAAFHRTIGGSGLNLAGRCVRILYTDRNEIIWLGVKACEPDAAARAVPSELIGTHH
jgi:hypothetical protein